MKALVTTHPFAETDSRPLEIAKAAGVEIKPNPLGRKLTESEVADLAADCDAIIAGTEKLGRLVFERAKGLKLVSRVGIGLDGVDLSAARERGIRVSYTPDAPAPAVAELAVGQMLTLLRHIPSADRLLHGGQWKRFFGRRLANLTVGIVGGGRIGGRVIRHLEGFSPERVLLYDSDPQVYSRIGTRVEKASLETIVEAADVISLHVPLTSQTRDLIGREQFARMKKDAILINTSRGGIVHEGDLYEALKSKRIQSAAVDVFELEPYAGPLCELENCLLTCHMGSMTYDCRVQMEIEATEEIARLALGQPLKNQVPESEYRIQVER